MTAAQQSHWRDLIDDAARWLHRALPLFLAFALGIALCVLFVIYR